MIGLKPPSTITTTGAFSLLIILGDGSFPSPGGIDFVVIGFTGSIRYIAPDPINRLKSSLDFITAVNERYPLAKCLNNDLIFLEKEMREIFCISFEKTLSKLESPNVITPSFSSSSNSSTTEIRAFAS